MPLALIPTKLAKLPCGGRRRHPKSAIDRRRRVRGQQLGPRSAPPNPGKTAKSRFSCGRAPRMAAAVGTVLHAVPVALPLLAPGEWQSACDADLAGQVRFAPHAWHV